MPTIVDHRRPVAVTSGPRFHFHGYYDKTPWDPSGRYIAALETAFVDRPPAADDTAVVGLVDTAGDNAWLPLASTQAWNWQQGSMIHWLGPTADPAFVQNDVRDGVLVSVVRALDGEELRVLPMPVYAVSKDASQAVTLNFARVHRTRPGYGYACAPDPSAGDLCPDDDGIWHMDLATGESRLIVTLAQIAAMRPKPNMAGAEHWFNHLLFNQDGSRFIFLHRWKLETGRWETRLFTAAPDGSDVCLLADHEIVSHFDWRGSDRVLAWARHYDVGDRFFLYTDLSEQREVVGDGVLTRDGHCSYSPDRRWVLNDAYPNRDNHRTLMLYRPADDTRIDIGEFYTMPELGGEIRCDLHPRWNRDGTKVCFDSTHEGERQVYTIDVADIVSG
ncbi:hypothetical protein HN371_05385 [Candidatus Poribacteria bacterium]|jgi:hypothetical protein|nr:hypothetical protein [Candidatus Poribacteria bacterium]MBT5533361.1 hypothetical protein [Candidatus Poribacteria bacterium]MBT5715107.1 hypothetical protein [Candidatus Poribacteria bacterium]MBT7099824.1 hypothetical protein [Candidatus Poribacteria bacterium]MBT7809509.1 hypothetical protein [Candidatus Poribacteria bacterium]